MRGDNSDSAFPRWLVTARHRILAARPPSRTIPNSAVTAHIHPYPAKAIPSRMYAFWNHEWRGLNMLDGQNDAVESFSPPFPLRNDLWKGPGASQASWRDFVLQEIVCCGVTSVGDMAGYGLRLEKAIEKGSLAGPKHLLV